MERHLLPLTCVSVRVVLHLRFNRKHYNVTVSTTTYYKTDRIEIVVSAVDLRGSGDGSYTTILPSVDLYQQHVGRELSSL